MADGDWVVALTDNIDRIVGSVRDKTTRPAVNVVRGLVFGLLAAFAVTSAIVLLAIGAVRLINNLLPGEVWIGHLVVGSIFVVVGLIVMRLRRPPTTTA